jgi:hypothetical protein
MSMTETRTRYYWKELTDDGRLIDVTYRESYAYDDAILGRWGYESESDAVKDLEMLVTEELIGGEFVLIKTYTVKKV